MPQYGQHKRVALEGAKVVTKKAGTGKPNILMIWGDDIGITNLSCYSDGVMGYRTPNIDRVANEGMRFTDYRAVRQEPPRRQGRVPADQARVRRVLRKPVPPQRRGGAGEPRLSAGG
jgi:hypothetical protein